MTLQFYSLHVCMKHMYFFVLVCMHKVQRKIFGILLCDSVLFSGISSLTKFRIRVASGKPHNPPVSVFWSTKLGVIPPVFLCRCYHACEAIILAWWAIPPGSTIGFFLFVCLLLSLLKINTMFFLLLHIQIPYPHWKTSLIQETKPTIYTSMLVCG